MEKIVKAALNYLEKRLENATALLVKENKRNTEELKKSLSELKPEPIKIQLPKVEKVDMSQVVGKLDQLLKKPVVEVDFTTLQNQLEALLEITKSNAPEKIGDKIDAMDAVFKGLKPKESVRFADDQMKALMSALTNGRGAGGGSATATGWAIDTVAVTAADTEYSYTFPANTMSWTLKLRGTAAVLYYAVATGKLPVSGDNSDYLTLYVSGARSQDGVEWSGKTIYFESNTAGQVVELEIFTL